MRRTLNVRFLAFLLVGIVLLGTGVHFLHAYQVKRSAKALLELAHQEGDQAKKEGDQAKAEGDQAKAERHQAEARRHLIAQANYLSNYLAYMPRDAEALFEYGLLLEHMAGPAPDRHDWTLFRRAYYTFEKVLRLELGLDKERDEVRNREIRGKLVDMAMEVGRYSDAQAHLEIILDPKLEKGVEKARLELLLGRCCEARGIFEASPGNGRGAKESFKSAIEDAPDLIDAYVSLANLYRRQLKNGNSANQADEVMKDLINRNDKSFQAYLARAKYWKEYKEPDKANADIRLAYEKFLAKFSPYHKLPSDGVEVFLLRAELPREQGKAAADSAKTAKAAKAFFEEARQILKRGLSLFRKEVRLYQALAEVELADNKPEEAKDWLKKGLKLAADKNQLLWTLANLAVDAGKDDNDPEFSEQIAQLRKAGALPAQLDYLSARIAVNKEEWPTAAEILEKIRPGLAKSPELVKQINFWLGWCYSQMQEPDQAYAAFKRTLVPDPLYVPACLGLGSALRAMGKLDEALEVYRRINARLETVRLLILKNQSLGLPPDNPQWAEIDNYLNQAEKGGAKSLYVNLLRADFLIATKKSDEAVTLLSKACAQEPRKVEYWTALAYLVDSQGKSERAALDILNKAEWRLVWQVGEAFIPVSVSDRANLLLARAQYWSRREADKAKRELMKLENTVLSHLGKGADKSSQLRWKVLSGLANAYFRSGNTEQAKRLWSQMARERPGDLNVRLLLFDIALENRDEANVKDLIKEIKRLEGEAGTLWCFAKARYLIWQAEREKGETDALLKEASTLLQTAATRRPYWSRVPLCKALIEDAKDNDSEALRHYQEAISLGERNPTIIGRTAQLLYKHGRSEQANDVLKMLPEQASLTADLQRLASQISGELAFQNSEDTADLKRALNLAEKAVSAPNPNYRDYLWLAQLYWKDGQGKKADSAFHQAIKLAEKNPQVWVSWVQHLARTDRKGLAEAAIKDAKAKIPAGQAPLALGQCYEIIGQLAEAKKHFQAALAAKPSDIATLRSVAAFQLRTGESEQAKHTLQELIDQNTQSPEDAAWARRYLAIVQVTGNYQESLKALRLLDGSNSESPEDLRAQALVLVAQKAHRKQNAKKAIALLEKIAWPTPDDRFLLARLYEQVDQWTKGRDLMIQLLASPEDQLPLLAYFVKSMIAHQEADKVPGPWITKLEEKLDSTFELAEIKATYWAATGKPGDATRTAQSYPDKSAKPPERADRLSLAAALLDNLSQTYPAENRYADNAERIYNELVAKRPEQVLLLASFLGRRGSIDRALDCCERAWPICPADKVGNTCLEILHRELRGNPDRSAHLERVERWLQAAVDKQPKDSSAITVCLASLRDLQGRYEEAENLYRHVIKKEPNNVVALNNLAWLLALRDAGTRGEALDLVERAIEIVGPMPALLDTQGVAYLAKGNVEDAILVFQQALEDEPAAAYSFHLAEAHLMRNDRFAAKTEFAKASSLGLKPDQIHPLEIRGYDQFREFGPPRAANQ